MSAKATPTKRQKTFAAWATAAVVLCCGGAILVAPDADDQPTPSPVTATVTATTAGSRLGVAEGTATAAPTPKRTTAKPKAVVKPKPKPKPKSTPTPTPQAVYYKNCTAVRAAGADPIHRGEPGYGRHLDRDGDGTACE